MAPTDEISAVVHFAQREGRALDRSAAMAQPLQNHGSRSAPKGQREKWCSRSFETASERGQAIMNGLLFSEDWFGAVLLIGTLLLIGLITAQFVRGSWWRDRQSRLHVYPRPHISLPSRIRH